ncbi:MAG: hypothetical protein JWN46_1046 [Acidimicrobiales bacterium]|nr:hypothetical protein [Acidimicrobiales bacterium]
MGGSAPSYERRIGRRLDLEARVIGWHLATAEDVHRPARKAGLVNISVTGAGLLLPTDAGLEIGSELFVELGGVWGAAFIAHARPTRNPELDYCGVSFIGEDPEFADAVAQLIGGPLGPGVRPPPTPYTPLA